MRTVVLYIAMSLDGYIADRSGGVGWLEGDGSAPGHPGSYPEFYAAVDTVIMGAATYRQITEELSPGEWPYEGRQTYVLTHRRLPDREGLTFTSRPLAELLNELKTEAGRDIWICGGACVVDQALAGDLIDRLWVTVAPTLLGGGIPLFREREGQRKLKLVSSGSYNGFTDLIFERRA